MTSPSQAAGGQAKPPEFRPVDIGALDDEVYRFTAEGLDLSMDDMDKRFPGLVAADQKRQKQDADAVSGILTPTEQSAFVRHGLERSAGAFGDATIGGEGSASRNTAAVTIARDTLQHQDQARQDFAQDLKDHPLVQMGLGGEDVTKLVIGNVVGQNISDRNAYLAAIGQLSADDRQRAQNQQALLAAAGSAYRAYGNYRGAQTDYNAGPYSSLTYGGGDGRP